jgi:hypothetical protein
LKRIYIAGAYSSPSVIGVLDNMRNGMRAAYDVIKAGYAPFVPWFDYHFALIGEMRLEEYYAYSMAWLEASDAVLVVPGWENSKGTIAEMEHARSMRIPIFFRLEDLKKEIKA